jgi:hypothetical protein
VNNFTEKPSKREFFETTTILNCFSMLLLVLLSLLLLLLQMYRAKVNAVGCCGFNLQGFFGVVVYLSIALEEKIADLR